MLGGGEMIIVVMAACAVGAGSIAALVGVLVRLRRGRVDRRRRARSSRGHGRS